MSLQNEPYIPDTREAVAGPELPQLKPHFDALTAGQRGAVRWDRARPIGLSAAALTPAQCALLEALVRVYTGRLAPSLAAAQEQRIARDGGIEALHFGWAGGIQRGEGHYYRIQGPDLVIEYDNTQDDANHIHAVLRSITSDFGLDALREHLREHGA